MEAEKLKQQFNHGWTRINQPTWTSARQARILNRRDLQGKKRGRRLRVAEQSDDEPRMDTDKHGLSRQKDGGRKIKTSIQPRMDTDKPAYVDFGSASTDFEQAGLAGKKERSQVAGCRTERRRTTDGHG